MTATGASVGLAVSGLAERENVGFLIPASEIKTLVDRWVAQAAAGQLNTPTPTPRPRPTATPRPRPTATPSIGPANPIVATIIPSLLPSGELAIGLNVRKTASQTGEVAYVVATNTTIELSGETTNVDGVVWWQLADGNWVQGQFLKFG